MNKKSKIMLSIMIAVIVIFFCLNGNTIRKGYVLFGISTCKGEDFVFAGQALTSWQCSICGAGGIERDTCVPKLCTKCSFVTCRCRWCGKLRWPEIEIQLGSPGN